MNGFKTQSKVKAGGKPVSSTAPVVSSTMSTCGTDCNCWTTARHAATSTEERRALAPYQQCYCEGKSCNQI